MRPVRRHHEVARGIELVVPGEANGDARWSRTHQKRVQGIGLVTGSRQAKSRQTNAVALPSMRSDGSSGMADTAGSAATARTW